MTDQEILQSVLDDMAAVYSEHSLADSFEDIMKMPEEEVNRISRAMTSGIDPDLLLKYGATLVEETSMMLIAAGPSEVHPAMAAMWVSGFNVGLQFQYRKDMLNGSS